MKRTAIAITVGIAASAILFSVKRKKSNRSKNDYVYTNGGEFVNKTVVITGAAGDIGNATAKAFAHRGANIVLVDLPSTDRKLATDKRDLLDIGAKNVHILTADMTESEAVQEMVKEAVNKCGSIDYFFNNAGIQGELLPLHEQSEDMFQRTLLVNTLGVFHGMKYVSQAMLKAQNGGVIVNTASLAGLQGPPNMAAYVASKFAVVGMTKTGAKDLGAYNIRVCAIAPGLIEGKMWNSQVRGKALCRKKKVDGDTNDVTEDELKEQELIMLQGTPLNRLGKLSEVAEAVVFLCSANASYISGSVMSIDGGRLS